RQQEGVISEKELYEDFVQKLGKKESLTEFYTMASKLDLAEEFADLIQQSHTIDFDKIKSTEDIILSFEALKTTLLKQSQVKPKNTADNGLVDQIKGNIKITPKGDAERIKLKGDLQAVEDALLQENFSKAVMIMSRYEKLYDLSAWLNTVKQRLDFEEFLKQVRNFKGPYKK
ncbi:MAG: hypothetical protein Q8K36_05300, partial [Alphaproteobacteria bacterium]|nr:hypothetical protein [Alphaproteobacteria bacterium]